MTRRSYFLVGCFAAWLISGGVIAWGTLSLLAWHAGEMTH